MRRRKLLGAVAAGTAVGVAGCLGGELVREKQESVRVEPHRGWVQEITEPSGSGSLSYTVRSEDARFQVLYFTTEEQFSQYRELTLGDAEATMTTKDGGSDAEAVPAGHDDLSSIALRNEQRDVYEAEMPTDDGRYSIEFDGTHYFVVDYSNYGRGLQVADTADPIQVTVGLEVVEDRL
jgi:hypothetical protein